MFWARHRLSCLGVDEQSVRSALREAAAAVRSVLDKVRDWTAPGTGHADQFEFDVSADRAAVEVLDRSGFGVLSEESGLHEPTRSVLVVLDPVDGSSNAARGLPWYATSLCALDASGPWVAVVVNQATGERFEAIRGRGARCNGRLIAPSPCMTLSGAVVGCSGWPPWHAGWAQLRVLDAAALDLCAVAAGRLDGWIDCERDAHRALGLFGWVACLP